MSRIAEIRGLLGPIRLKKGRGQTFMLDPNLLAAMVRDAGVSPDDVVLEIGTGLGALTEKLAAAGRSVISVEIDAALVEIARKRLAGLSNVEILHAGFLGRSDTVCVEVEDRLTSHLERAARTSGKSGAAPMVVSNLPYSLSGPIIAALMLWKMPLSSTVVTLQKEMAERIVANPGSKAYGRLSVVVQSAVDVELLRVIPSDCFWPRPRVDSAVVRFGAKDSPDENLTVLAKLVKNVFQHRRKTIRNALVGGTILNLSSEEVDGLLVRSGVEKSARADAVTVEQFERMVEILMSGRTG